MATRLEDLNGDTPIVDRGGTATRYFSDWLRPVLDRIQAAAYAVTGAVVALVDKAATIGLSALVPVAGGLYRLSYTLQITQAAAVSSDATVTFTFTRHGAICTVSGAIVNSNVLNAVGQGSFLVRADPGSVISYDIAYNSVGAPAMQFGCDLVAEALG